MDHTDNELQGTNSSGSLGGLDVRRRIPIKLISKQGGKAKAAPRTPRTINRMPAKAPPGDEGPEMSREAWHCGGVDCLLSLTLGNWTLPRLPIRLSQVCFFCVR
uniref:Cbl proto-onco like 1 n=1 Tax=Equus caballus TaxID=9796 RepID=A0A9L0SYD0_HORSE